MDFVIQRLMSISLHCFGLCFCVHGQKRESRSERVRKSKRDIEQEKKKKTPGNVKVPNFKTNNNYVELFLSPWELPYTVSSCIIITFKNSFHVTTASSHTTSTSLYIYYLYTVSIQITTDCNSVHKSWSSFLCKEIIRKFCSHMGKGNHD